eukprot:c3817_g1_i1 orf=13-240(+)
MGPPRISFHLERVKRDESTSCMSRVYITSSSREQSLPSGHICHLVGFSLTLIDLLKGVFRLYGVSLLVCLDALFC